MEIQKYGVTLKRITKSDIELIRMWRNDSRISKYMFFRKYITKDMQRKWFFSIDNGNNFYFIIEVLGENVGLINIKDIDYSSSTGEVGLFIYDLSYQNDYLPFRASLTLGDFAFYQLGMKNLKAHVLKNNRRAIRYNKYLGFVLQPGQEDYENQLYIQSKEDYVFSSKKVKKVLSKV